MVTKFWTTQEGIIGTAHINRYGELVDFRPSPFTYFSGKKFYARAPKGQEHLEELNLQTSVMGYMASFPWRVGEVGVGTGKYHQLVFLSVFVQVELKETLIPLNLQYEEAHTDVETTESRAVYEAVKAKREAEFAAVKAARQAQKETLLAAGKAFEVALPSLYAGLNTQEKRWIRKFIKNYKKAEAEATGVLKRLDPVGFKGLEESVQDSLDYTFYTQRLSLLLGEILNIK